MSYRPWCCSCGAVAEMQMTVAANTEEEIMDDLGVMLSWGDRRWWCCMLLQMVVRMVNVQGLQLKWFRWYQTEMNLCWCSWEFEDERKEICCCCGQGDAIGAGAVKFRRLQSSYVVVLRMQWWDAMEDWSVADATWCRVDCAVTSIADEQQGATADVNGNCRWIWDGAVSCRLRYCYCYGYKEWRIE